MKEYQIRSDRKRILPGAVYHQCIWIVKDMDRLREITNHSFQQEFLSEDCVVYGTSALQRSPEEEEAEFKLDCIQRALLQIPEEYREGILDNICHRGTGYGDFAHENTWKKWKQRFIYALAANLRLIQPNIY